MSTGAIDMGLCGWSTAVLRALQVLMAVLFVTVPAFGQSDEDRLGARAVLLQQAQTASRAGQHAEAVELARRAGRIQWSPSVRRFLAEELIATGDLGAGFGAYQACIREANAGTARDAPHGAACREGARQLESRIGLLRVVVAAPVPAEVVVTVGPRTLDAALLGTPVPVTPGQYTVTVTAPGRRPWRRTLDVMAQQTVSLDVRLDSLPPPPVPVVPAAPVPATVPAAPLPAPPLAPASPAPDLARVTAQLAHPPQPVSPPIPRGPNAGLIAAVTVGCIVVVGAVAGGVGQWAVDRAAAQQPAISLTPGYYSGGIVTEPSP